MTSLPVQISEQGLPSRFANDFATGTVLTNTANNPPSPGWVWVVQGIDMSAGNSGLTMNFWYKLPGGGKVILHSATAGTETEVQTQWRGALPVPPNSSIEFGIECLAGADLAICAWGIVVPVPLGVII